VFGANSFDRMNSLRKTGITAGDGSRMDDSSENAAAKGPEALRRHR
jgi:hypothetical protein